MGKRNVEIRETTELVVIAKHAACDTHLQMGTYRVPFCPSCKVAVHRGYDMPDKVLCCVECEEPLAVTQIHGSYCIGCSYHPSMQDTFFKPIA